MQATCPRIPTHCLHMSCEVSVHAVRRHGDTDVRMARMSVGKCTCRSSLSCIGLANSCRARAHYCTALFSKPYRSSYSLSSMYQLRPELDNVLQCLSLNGYSVFSLIDDILARCNWEDDRIKILWKGVECDAVDICARLLCYITSGPERVIKFGRVQCTSYSRF